MSNRVTAGIVSGWGPKGRWVSEISLATSSVVKESEKERERES